MPLYTRCMISFRDYHENLKKSSRSGLRVSILFMRIRESPCSRGRGISRNYHRNLGGNKCLGRVHLRLRVAKAKAVSMEHVRLSAYRVEFFLLLHHHQSALRHQLDQICLLFLNNSRSQRQHLQLLKKPQLLQVSAFNSLMVTQNTNVMSK